MGFLLIFSLLLAFNTVFWIVSLFEPIVIVNKYIPFGNFLAITFGNLIFTKKPLNDMVYRHECKHVEQYRQNSPLIFLFLYCLEYLINLLKKRMTPFEAYYNISFEKEAREAEKIK